MLAAVVLCVTRVRQKPDSSLIARIGIVRADRRPYRARIIHEYVCLRVYVYGNVRWYSGKPRRPHVGFAAARTRESPIFLLASMNPGAT